MIPESGSPQSIKELMGFLPLRQQIRKEDLPEALIRVHLKILSEGLFKSRRQFATDKKHVLTMLRTFKASTEVDTVIHF